MPVLSLCNFDVTHEFYDDGSSKLKVFPTAKISLGLRVSFMPGIHLSETFIALRIFISDLFGALFLFSLILIFHICLVQPGSGMVWSCKFCSGFLEISLVFPLFLAFLCLTSFKTQAIMKDKHFDSTRQ